MDELLLAGDVDFGQHDLATVSLEKIIVQDYSAQPETGVFLVDTGIISQNKAQEPVREWTNLLRTMLTGQISRSNSLNTLNIRLI